MPAAPLPEDFWLLADPAQEVLMDGRPTFSQLAPVPLRQLGSDTILAGEPYRGATAGHDTGRGLYDPGDR